MKRYLILYAVITTVHLVCIYRHYRNENGRLTQNQTALMSQMEHYRTCMGQEAASAHLLRLRCEEFERLRAADAELIRGLGIRLRRVEASAKTMTETRAEVRVPLCDTIVVREQPDASVVHDSMRMFRWRDPWVTIEGLVGRDSVLCRLHSIDTLRQIVHRVPRRFLFIRWGTKALRQEILSSNPHTRIVYSEYVKFER